MFDHNMCVLLTLALAKRISELNDLFYKVKHTKGWTCCTFFFVPSFVTNIQDSALQHTRFNMFFISSLEDFLTGGREEMLP